MKYDLKTELGYVLMDLESIRAYTEVIMRDYAKVVDRIVCIRMDLTNDGSKGANK